MGLKLSSLNLRVGVRFPTAFWGFFDFAGSKVAGGHTHAFDRAVLDDFYCLQIWQKTTDADAGGFETDTACFFGNTAGGDSFAHAGLFACVITNSGHFISLN